LRFFFPFDCSNLFLLAQKSHFARLTQFTELFLDFDTPLLLIFILTHQFIYLFILLPNLFLVSRPVIIAIQKIDAGSCLPVAHRPLLQEIILEKRLFLMREFSRSVLNYAYHTYSSFDWPLFFALLIPFLSFILKPFRESCLPCLCGEGPADI
jgi:hypothetical protein